MRVALGNFWFCITLELPNLELVGFLLQFIVQVVMIPLFFILIVLLFLGYLEGMTTFSI
jgi:hypothetical protein